MKRTRPGPPLSDYARLGDVVSQLESVQAHEQFANPAVEDALATVEFVRRQMRAHLPAEDLP